MNIQNMLTDLCRLDREWERNCYSPDLVNQKEWTEGVWFGVRTVLRLVQRHAHRRRRNLGFQSAQNTRLLRSLGPIRRAG